MLTARSPWARDWRSPITITSALRCTWSRQSLRSHWRRPSSPMSLRHSTKPSVITSTKMCYSSLKRSVITGTSISCSSASTTVRTMTLSLERSYSKRCKRRLWRIVWRSRKPNAISAKSCPSSRSCPRAPRTKTTKHTFWSPSQFQWRLISLILVQRTRISRRPLKGFRTAITALQL